ncbi:hypothetical protein Hanom_Chr05g00449011 [Helianthus anomalus]
MFNTRIKERDSLCCRVQTPECVIEGGWVGVVGGVEEALRKQTRQNVYRNPLLDLYMDIIDYLLVFLRPNVLTCTRTF